MGQETKRELSPGVARRAKLSMELEEVLAEAIPDVAAAYAEMVEAALAPEERPPDIAASLDGYRRVMALVRRNLVSADLDHLAGLDEESQLCADRDGRTVGISKTLSRVRRACLGWFGPDGLKPLGLAAAVAQGSPVVAQATEAVRRMRDYTPDAEGGEGSSGSDHKRWLAALADEIEPDLRAVRAFSGALERVRSRSVPRAERRREAMATFDQRYLSIGRIAEATLRMSGKSEEADRIQPSMRKLQRKGEE